MLGKTHLAISVILLFLLSRFTTLINGIEIPAAIIILFASVFPDIDQSKSIIGRKVKIISFLSKHRGFFHSIFAMILFTVVVKFLFNSNRLCYVFLIGYSSHLIADSITKEGTTLFYPNKLKIKGKLKVGSPLETLIYLLLVVLGFYLVL